MIQEMQKATEIAAKHHDEVGLLKRQLQAKEERVKSLQGLYNSSNESLSKKTAEVFELKKQMHTAGAGLNRRPSMERRAIKGGVRGKAPVSRGIKGGGVRSSAPVSRGIKGGGSSAAPQVPADQDLETEVFV